MAFDINKLQELLAKFQDVAGRVPSIANNLVAVVNEILDAIKSKPQPQFAVGPHHPEASECVKECLNKQRAALITAIIEHAHLEEHLLCCDDTCEHKE